MRREGGERTGVRLLSSLENDDKSDGSLVDVDDAHEAKDAREKPNREDAAKIDRERMTLRSFFEPTSIPMFTCLSFVSL